MKSNRRIAFLSEHASPMALLGGVDAGGQNVYVDELSRNLGRLGYAVDVFTRRDSPELPAVVEWAPGVRVVHLDVGPPEFLPKDELWRHMPAFRDALLRFSMRAGARYDLAHGNFWMSGWVASELRRLLGIPAVQIFHALGETKRRHQGEADTSPDDRIAVEHAVIRGVDRLIAQCPAELAELVDDYGADPAQVVVIPSAVNVELFRPLPQPEARRRVGLPSDEPTIVYVGRVLPRKDIRNVVRALALLVHRAEGEATLERAVGEAALRPAPQISRETPRLLVVGGETEEPDPAVTAEIGVLRELAAELGVSDRVTFAGKRQPEELHAYYSAGDVAVTTPWYEPFGLTPLEAMACARPVVGSAVGGISFTVRDGVTGALVPPRDPEALAEALRRILAEPELRDRMGRAARQRVEREFTWPVVARRTAALYESLLDAAAPARRGTRARQSRIGG